MTVSLRNACSLHRTPPVLPATTLYKGRTGTTDGGRERGLAKESQSLELLLLLSLLHYRLEPGSLADRG